MRMNKPTRRCPDFGKAIALAMCATIALAACGSGRRGRASRAVDSR